MRGLAHAPEVCQFDFERAWLIEHLAQQTGIAGVVLDKKNSDGFFCSSLCNGREFDNGQPEIVDSLDDFQELVQVHRLGDVAVGMKLVTPQDVLFSRQGGQDYHRDTLQSATQPNFFKNPPSRLL